MPALSADDRAAFERVYFSEVLAKYERWSIDSSPLGIAAWPNLEDFQPPLDQSLPARFQHLWRETIRYKIGLGAAVGRYADLQEAVDRYPELILLGNPGAGKTTTLWELVHDEASLTGIHPPDRLPILLRLCRYDGNLSLLDWIRAELSWENQTHSPGEEYPAHAYLAARLEDYLGAQRLCFLFDGLDEISFKHQAEAFQRLAAFCEKHRGNHFLFTNSQSTDLLGGDMPEVLIQDLDAGARHNFLAALFPAQAGPLGEALELQNLKESAQNPHTLLMLFRVYAEKGEFPSRRGQLFQEWLDLMLTRPSLNAREQGPDLQMTRRALSSLALAIQREQGRGSCVSRAFAEFSLAHAALPGSGPNPSSLADLLSSDGGKLLLETSPDGSLNFRHLLFQDYFAALGLTELEETHPIWDAAVRYPQWDPVLILYAGLVADATPLVKRLMPIDLYLAARCVPGAQAVQPRTVNALRTRLAKKLQNPFQSERVRAAQALSELGFESAIPLILGLIRSEDAPTRDALAHMLLRVEPERLLPYLKPLLRHPDARWRAWAVRLLGDIKAVRAVSRLIQLTYDSDAQVRMAVVDALYEILGEGAIPYIIWLLNDRSAAVRSAAARALSRLAPAAVISNLSPRAQPPHPGLRAQNGRPWPNHGPDAAIPALVSLLKDNVKEVRRTAAEIIAKVQPELVVPHLLPLLQDRDPQVRWLTADVLGNLRAESAVPQLLALLNDRAAGIQAVAARSLWNIMGEEIAPHLIPLLRDQDWYVRCIAIQVLGRLGSDRAIPHLLPLLRDSDGYVRWLTGQVLIGLKAEGAVSDLIQLLQDKDWYVRLSAAEVLGRTGTRAAAGALSQLLQDPVAEVRRAAAEALGEIDPRANVRPGPEAEVSPSFRSHRTRRKGDDDSEAAVARLIALLRHPTPAVREDAERALATRAGEQHLHLLAPLLSDDRPEISNAAQKIIEQIKYRLNLPKDYAIRD